MYKVIVVGPGADLYPYNTHNLMYIDFAEMFEAQKAALAAIQECVMTKFKMKENPYPTDIETYINSKEEECTFMHNHVSIETFHEGPDDPVEFFSSYDYSIEEGDSEFELLFYARIIDLDCHIENDFDTLYVWRRIKYEYTTSNSSPDNIITLDPGRYEIVETDDKGTWVVLVGYDYERKRHVKRMQVLVYKEDVDSSCTIVKASKKKEEG